jgi:hypothetical protein
MNQRYHQHEAHRWWWCDTIAKIVTAVFAVIGMALAIVSASVDSWLADSFGVAVSLIAAVSAVVLNVIPFGAWESKSADLFRRWTDLREEVDTLEFELGDGQPSADLTRWLQDLDAKLHRIVGSEVLANPRLLSQCEYAERRSRGLAATAPPPARWWERAIGIAG